MLTASQIIADLGGPAKVARATGFPLTTIDSWRTANFIPTWRRDALLGLARTEGVSISDRDFPVRTRPTSEQAAA